MSNDYLPIGGKGTNKIREKYLKGPLALEWTYSCLPAYLYTCLQEILLQSGEQISGRSIPNSSLRWWSLLCSAHRCSRFLEDALLPDIFSENTEYIFTVFLNPYTLNTFLWLLLAIITPSPISARCPENKTLFRLKYTVIMNIAHIKYFPSKSVIKNFLCIQNIKTN